MTPRAYKKMLFDDGLHPQTSMTLAIPEAARKFANEIYNTNTWEETLNVLENFAEYLKDNIEKASAFYEEEQQED